MPFHIIPYHSILTILYHAVLHYTDPMPVGHRLLVLSQGERARTTKHECTENENITVTRARVVWGVEPSIEGVWGSGRPAPDTSRY